MPQPRFVPSSTYRLQVHAGFTLQAAAAIVPYLRRLGISAVYTSPYFAAEPGSTHGYDVTNHNDHQSRSRRRRGAPRVQRCCYRCGAAAHRRLRAQSHGHQYGDQPVVARRPRHGPESPSARFFDIDWNPFKTELRREAVAAHPWRSVRQGPRSRRAAARTHGRPARPGTSTTGCRSMPATSPSSRASPR